MPLWIAARTAARRSVLVRYKSGHLQCPFHGFEFDPTGKCVLIPANGRNGVIPNAMRLNSYPTYEAHGLIWLWWGSPAPQELPAPEFFDNLDDSFSYGSAHDPWNAHYSRVIENQLDVVHLPFIHRKTIGRGNRTLVDGPVVEWKGDRMLYTYVYNRLDDGTPPRKPRSSHPRILTVSTWNSSFPTCGRTISVKMCVSWLPSFRWMKPTPCCTFVSTRISCACHSWANWLPSLAMPSNTHIAHEDRRVVITQQPKPSGLKIGEILIQGDLPIIEYRKKRSELQNRNNQH